MTDRQKHPSGRPVRREPAKKRSGLVQNGIGPWALRLREPQLKDAMGFGVRHVNTDDWNGVHWAGRAEEDE